MAKEAKLGVALIAVLLGAFGLVLYKRIKEATPAKQAVADAQTEPKPAAAEPEKPKLSSGPLKPAVVQTSSLDKAPGTPSSSSFVNSSGSGSRYNDKRAEPAAPTTQNAGQDPFAATTSTSSSRYADRYSNGTRQIYGSQDATPLAATEPAQQTELPTSAANSTDAPSAAGDPFSSQGNRTGLTPAADASAALLPATATTDAIEPNKPAEPLAAETTVAETTATTDTATTADYNPLRAATAESNPATPNSRTSGPQGYNLYGGAETTTTSSTATTTSEPPASGEPRSSRVRFAQPGGGADRYASQPTVASEPEPTAPVERIPADRYGTSATNSTTTSTGLPANPATTRYEPSRTGWSSTGTAASVSAASTLPKAATSTTASPAPVRSTRSLLPVVRGETYVVEPNDSFSSISTKLYGTDAYFKALQEHNKAKYPRPDRLRTGDVVSTPSSEVLQQKYPNLCPRPNHVVLPGRTSGLASQRGSGRVYVVEEGDTLFDIARFELGKATRWAEIYELNKDVIGEDVNHLRPGTQLVLPAETRDDSFTRRPGSPISR